jgi:ribosomal protein L20
MARVKRGVTARARHKKVVKLAKGYRGRGNNVFRVAIERIEKGLQYAYRDRRATRSGTSAASGSSASTPVRASMVLPTRSS